MGVIDRRITRGKAAAIIAAADAEFGIDGAELPPRKRVRLPVKCKCGAASPGEHTCPYAEEINNDDRTCDCCDDCRYQCAMDI